MHKVQKQVFLNDVILQTLLAQNSGWWYPTLNGGHVAWKRQTWDSKVLAIFYYKPSNLLSMNL